MERGFDRINRVFMLTENGVRLPALFLQPHSLCRRQPSELGCRRVPRGIIGQLWVLGTACRARTMASKSFF